MSPEEQDMFWREFHTYKFVADKGRVAMYIENLSMMDDLQVDPAGITDTPCPKLPECWLKVLGANGSSDDPPVWRSPMLFTPQIRGSSWPTTEIKYKHNGSPDHKTRNLVLIEGHQDHKYFMSDIDPWRLGCVGEPRPDVPVHERRATCRRLPRPPKLALNLPLSQLAEVARGIHDCTCGRDTHYYYLPPLSWQPTNRGRDDWRKSAFDRDGVVLKEGGRRETGCRDRNGHIWVWDESENHENHWDVKTANDIRIAKVRYDGLKLSS